MPRYVLTQKAYINGSIHDEGAIVETDLRPGSHMSPALDDKGRPDKDAVKAIEEANREAKEKGKRNAMPGDPGYIGDMIEHAVGDGRTNGRVDPPPAGVVVDDSGQVRGIS